MVQFLGATITNTNKVDFHEFSKKSKTIWPSHFDLHYFFDFGAKIVQFLKDRAQCVVPGA